MISIQLSSNRDSNNKYKSNNENESYLESNEL